MFLIFVLVAHTAGAVQVEGHVQSFHCWIVQQSRSHFSVFEVNIGKGFCGSFMNFSHRLFYLLVVRKRASTNELAATQNLSSNLNFVLMFLFSSLFSLPVLPV